MSNIIEVRDILVDNLKKMRDGEVDHKLGQAIINNTGKIIASIAVELKYFELRNEEPDIEFIRDGTSKGTKRSLTIHSIPQIEGFEKQAISQ